MSPRAADPAVRMAYIEAAAHLLATEGRAALSTRRLAGEVGTSTMALYTYFGSMDELLNAVRREGFARLSDRLSGVRLGKDPVANLVHLGIAYFGNAAANPDLYRVMFVDLVALETDDEQFAFSTLQSLTDGVQRAIDAGRFKPPKGSTAADLTSLLWVAIHGVVMLHLAGLVDADVAARQARALSENLFVGFGDTPAAVKRSLKRADEEQLINKRYESLVAGKA